MLLKIPKLGGINLNIKSFGAFLLALLMSCSAFISCSKNENKETSENEKNIVTENSKNIISNTEKKDNSPSHETEKDSENNSENNNISKIEPKYYNNLTGVETSQKLSTQRPVAIMFNNLKAALPQHGISEMDLLYEVLVEGSITRLMGVAADWKNLPTLGSIRSSRDYYIDLADAHNAIYVHAGGSEIAYSTMRSRGTNHIDGTNGNSASTAAFYRNQERLKKRIASEHTLFTSGSNITKAIESNKFSTVLKDNFESPIKFSNSPIVFNGDSANYVYVPFSNYAQSYFDYSAESGLYSKGQYLNVNSSLDKHDSPHIDGNTNEQIKFKNIVILFAKHSTIDNYGRLSVDFTGTGKGYYFSNGKCKEIIWKRANRTSGYSLLESDGVTELLLNVGKTYIGIVKPNVSVVYK